jgi:hypothetical protein
MQAERQFTTGEVVRVQAGGLFTGACGVVESVRCRPNGRTFYLVRFWLLPATTTSLVAWFAGSALAVPTTV